MFPVLCSSFFRRDSRQPVQFNGFAVLRCAAAFGDLAALLALLILRKRLRKQGTGQAPDSPPRPFWLSTGKRSQL
jgi:hypothetical protein